MSTLALSTTLELTVTSSGAGIHPNFFSVSSANCRKASFAVSRTDA
jgi:hypothetical protein